MKSKLVLFDVDGTLIGRDYELSVPEDIWRQAVHEAKTGGMTLGLSSDTPAHTMTGWARRFDMDGPVVAERGAVVLQHPSAEPLIVRDGLEQFGTLWSVVQKSLANIPDSYIIGEGDANDFTSWIRALPPGQPGQVAVFGNRFRRASFSCWIRLWNGQAWVIRDEAIREAWGDIDRCGGGTVSLWNERDVDANPKYGVIIVHHRDTKKSMAIPQLRNWFGGFEMAMVGDGVTDWLEDTSVQQFAVANAVPEYQRHCNWVAPSPITQGAIEVLHHLGRLR